MAIVEATFAIVEATLAFVEATLAIVEATFGCVASTFGCVGDAPPFVVAHYALAHARASAFGVRTSAFRAP
ncbi:MAG: hypothetical protein AAB288_14080 [Acidobacteriota bacterium]